MFAKFSPASGRVLRAAEQECRNHNHYYVGVEHLLVALLEEDAGISEALRTEQIDPAEVHAEARRSLGTGEDRLWEGILVTPRVRKIVTLAEGIAGERAVEPLDLLEAIKAEGASLAAEILRRAKCTS